MSGINAVETKVNDPLLYLAPVPYVGRFYPNGFPVDIATNMQEVLDAAHESWGACVPRFDTPPIRMHILASEGSAVTPPSPALRGRGHLLMWVSDQENFAVCDRLQRFGYSIVTRATVADRVFFRWHFLEAVVLVLQELTCYTAIHAACVAWEGAGVLLYGESGVGKSTLSYACARRGWTYISDDSSSLLWDRDKTVIGEPHHFRFRSEAQDLFPELRGLTVGRELDRKPTIEVYTADLPIRTAPECRVERIVFLDRRQDGRSGITGVGSEETLERLRQHLPVFDPELEPWRLQMLRSVADLPSYEMCYASFEEAVDLLEQLMRRGGPVR